MLYLKRMLYICTRDNKIYYLVGELKTITLKLNIMYTQGIPVNTSHVQILNKDGITLIAGSLEAVNNYKKANGIKEVTYCKVYYS